MEYSPILRLEATSDRTSDLRCPRCDSINLHQAGVTIFERKEDDALVTRIAVDGPRAEVTVTPSNGSDNPSARRHGLVIRFLCEGCNWTQDPPDLIELTIAQHKGSTEIGWRFEREKKH